MRRFTLAGVRVFMIALPNYTAVFAGGVPRFRAIKPAAFTADNFTGKTAKPLILLTYASERSHNGVL